MKNDFRNQTALVLQGPLTINLERDIDGDNEEGGDYDDNYAALFDEAEVQLAELQLLDIALSSEADDWGLTAEGWGPEVDGEQDTTETEQNQQLP